MLPINYLAILIGAIINVVIGSLWYSPLLFGKAWMKLNGFEKGNMDNMKKEMKKKYGYTLISAILMTLVLEIFIKMIGVQTIIGGFRIGFLAWVGFAATAQFTNWLFSGKSKDLFIIDTTYPLVTYTIIGAILAVWK